MDKPAIKEFLLSMGLTPHSETKTHVMVSCPFAKWLHSSGADRNPSFGISNSYPSIGHCFSCGSKGTLEQIFGYVGDRSGVDYSSRLEWLRENDRETVESILRQPEKQEMLVMVDEALHWPSALDSLDCMAYLAGRNVDHLDVARWDLRYDEVNERVVFPIYTFGLNGAVGRNLHYKGFHNYWNCYTGLTLGGYNQICSNKLILVESFFDMIRANRALNPTYSAVSVFKADVSDFQIELIKNTDCQVFAGFDQDQAGKNLAGRLRRAGLRGYTIARWDTYKDLAEMSDSEIQSIFIRN